MKKTSALLDKLDAPFLGCVPKEHRELAEEANSQS
jgi:hypothetical protein